jgi:O-antigen/teichoic acid export membrane protein
MSSTPENRETSGSPSAEEETSARAQGEGRFLAKKSLIYGLGNFLSRVSAFIMLPVYTNYLSPTDYGVKELLAITTDVLGVLIGTAISQSLYRFYFDEEEERQRNLVISSGMVFVGAAGLILLLAAFIYSKSLTMLILDDLANERLFQLAIAALWFQIITNVAQNYLRVKQEAMKLAALALAALVLSLSLNILFVVHMGMGVEGILLSTLIVSVLNFLVITVPISVKVGLGVSFPILKKMLKFGLPMVPSQLGAFFVHLSDRFFIKEYVSMGQAGIYSLGYRIGTLPGMFVVSPFNQTYLPRRFELAKKPDAEKILGQIFTQYLAFLVFVGLGIVVFAKVVIMVMADETFWSAHKVIPIIVVANIIFSLHYHFDLGLYLANKTKVIAAIDLTNGAFVLGLNWLLIPRYGIYGAAIATVIAFSFKVIMIWLMGRKHFCPQFEYMRIVKLVLSAVLVGAVSYVWEDSRLVVNILARCLLMLGFVGVLYSLKFFTTEEIRQLRDLITGKLRRILRR